MVRKLSVRRMAANNKGQAIIEMAILGAVILMAFGILLNYIQKNSEQQYVQMESFRRGLSYACMFPLIDAGIGAGASVDYTAVRNRRFVDLSPQYKKGDPQSTTATSSIYWAVPKVGEQSYNLVVYRINEDESPFNLSTLFSFLSREEVGKYVSLSMNNIDSTSAVQYHQTKTKSEDSDKIVNTQQVRFNDAITTSVYSSFKPMLPIDIDDETAQSLISWLEGEIGSAFNVRVKEFEITQHLYKKPDGQYGYSKRVIGGGDVLMGRKWETRQ